MTKSFLLVILLIFGLFISISAQTDALKNDLRNMFQKVSVIRLDKSEMLRAAETNQTLSITTTNQTFELSLTPNDLRSPRYVAEDTTASGIRRLERTNVTTYKGKIVGDAGSEVRLTIDGGKIEGYFSSKTGRFFIEPADRFSKLATDADFVVYQEKDLLVTETFSCEMAEKIEKGKEFVAANIINSPQTFRVIELGTESDFEFVSFWGGAVQANNEVLSILNMVEGVYESEVGLTMSIVFQHTWSTADAFGTTTPIPMAGRTCASYANKVLCNFQDYWNANYPLTQYPRDAAHIFTAKANALAQGIAFLNVICNNPAFAYGLSGKVDWAPAKFDVTAHEIGHNLGANHADAAQNCSNTIMNTQLSATTPLTFCSLSRGEITNFVTANGSCLSQQNLSAVRFDFDGDAKADTSIFRPLTGVWYIANSGTSGFSIFQFGMLGDKPVAADFDGDGKTDAAVYRGGLWYRMKSATNTVDVISFGILTDVPVPADFDGDGKADIAVFRPSNGSWHRLNSGENSYTALQFGMIGDFPLPADFDGDGKADVNVFRPSNGVWYRINSANGSFFATQFGTNGDQAATGDFDGDAKADLAVWRPSTGVWYVQRSSNGTFLITAFGLIGDMPVAADYDGDGKTDIAVFRPSNGVWHRLNSSSGAYLSFQFGISTDIPAPAFVF